MRITPVSNQNFNAHYRVPHKDGHALILMDHFHLIPKDDMINEFARSAFWGTTMKPFDVGRLFTDLRKNEKGTLISFFNGTHPEKVKYWNAFKSAIFPGAIYNDEIEKLDINPSKVTFEKVYELLAYRMNVLEQKGIDADSIFMKYTTILTGKDISELIKYKGQLMHDGISKSKLGQYVSFSDEKTTGSKIDYSATDEKTSLQTVYNKNAPKLNIFQQIYRLLTEPSEADLVNSGVIEPPYIKKAQAVVENNKLAQAQYDEFIAGTKIQEVATIEELINMLNR